MKINLYFNQLRLNYLKNQKKKKKKEKKKQKEHLRFVIISIRVDLFAKHDGEICVLSTIKTYNCFSLISLMCQSRSSCLKYQKWCSFFENRYHQSKMVEKKKINFSVSPYCTLLFPRKEKNNFSDVALVAVHWKYLISWIIIAWGCRPWNTANTCLFVENSN